MKAQEIVDFVFEIAPNPDWGQENIFEFGNGDCEVYGVGVAWWITSKMLTELSQKGCNFALSHERTTYPLAEWYRWGEAIAFDDLKANRRIAELAQTHGFAIHRFHSNIDLAPWGMPRALVRRLGWDGYGADWSRGIPVVEMPARTLRELVEEVKARLGLPFVRFNGDPQRRVRRVALAWGGLCQGWDAAACAAPLGYDVLLGGDIIDGVVRLAREQDWAVIDAMHHATEMEAMKELAVRLQNRFPSLRVEYLENSMPWMVL